MQKPAKSDLYYTIFWAWVNNAIFFYAMEGFWARGKQFDIL